METACWVKLKPIPVSSNRKRSATLRRMLVLCIAHLWKSYNILTPNSIPDGVLHRGCQGDLTADEIKACTGKTCEICEADKCSKIFPEGRLRCYQCNSNSDKTCVNELSGESKSSYCKVYKADDQCYSRIADNTCKLGHII